RRMRPAGKVGKNLRKTFRALGTMSRSECISPNSRCKLPGRLWSDSGPSLRAPRFGCRFELRSTCVRAQECTWNQASCAYRHGMNARLPAVVFLVPLASFYNQVVPKNQRVHARAVEGSNRVRGRAYHRFAPEIERCIHDHRHRRLRLERFEEPPIERIDVLI